MKYVKCGLLIGVVLIGGFFWYWLSNKPEICTSNMILATETQLQKNVVSQILSRKDFEGLLDFVSQGEYAVYSNSIKCKMPEKSEDMAYSVAYRSIKGDEHSVFQIFSIPTDQYHVKYAEMLGNQVQKKMDLIIDDEFIFWNSDGRYNYLTARPTWIKILRSANIYGKHNKIVADQKVKRISNYTFEEMNYPYFNQWISNSSEGLSLSFRFQSNGTFMANYSKNVCCTNVFNGYYRVSGAVITLDFDMSTQSVIESANIPFSWDGEILKLQIDGDWVMFELVSNH